MQPSTSRIATGSLTPDSPSSVRARRRRNVEPRRTANTAAASVAATVEPTSSASSGSRSSSSDAAKAVIPAVSAVPIVASAIETPITGRISAQPLDRPPSYRINASAMTRGVLRDVEVPEVDPVRPVGPDRHPEHQHQHQAGQAQPAREQRGDDPGGEQRTDPEHERTDVHRPGPFQKRPSDAEVIGHPWGGPNHPGARTDHPPGSWVARRRPRGCGHNVKPHPRRPTMFRSIALATVTAALAVGITVPALSLAGGDEEVPTPRPPVRTATPVATPAAAPTRQDVIQQVSRGVVQISGQVGDGRASGTGIVIDAAKGLIATNAHVVAGMSSIEATLPDGSRVPARLVASSPATTWRSSRSHRRQRSPRCSSRRPPPSPRVTTCWPSASRSPSRPARRRRSR